MKIWVKFYTETLRDPKIGSLSWAHRGIWSALLALAGELDHRNESGEETGELDTIGNVAWYLRCTEEELQEAVREFTQRRMVHEDENGVLFVTNYPQRQSRPPSSRPEQVADRVRRYRERRAKRNEDVTTIRKDSNEGETTLDTEIEIETEKETESPPAGADAPPTPADGVPDPVSLTVAEIQALDLAEDQWRQLLEQETQGKNRVTVHRHVQAVLNLPVEEEKHERAPPTGKNKLKLELADHFAEVTLIPLPSGSGVYPELNKRWWEPLLRIASVCEDDLERTKALIEWTVAEMDAARLTIKTPQSIEGNAVNEQLRRLREAERSNNGAHPSRGRARARAPADREPPPALSAEEAERFRRLQEQRKRERAGPT